MPVVGYVLVIMAAVSVISVLYMVMREKHPETEEHYIPPAPGTTARQERSAPDAMHTAEVVGTEMISPSPVIDEEARRQAEENR